MAIEIFLSYRRGETGGHARAMHMALLQWFDPARVFFDRDTLEPGDDFPERIDSAVRECRVLLALVGPTWISPEPGTTVTRLFEPNDIVRREIGLALALDKKVIPVLLDGARAPGARGTPELPAELAGLARCNALELGGRTSTYDHDLQTLVQALARDAGVTAPRARTAGPTAERDKLPLLCDRSLQDDAAADAVRAELRGTRRRPIVLVLHGRADEEHHAFVERLESFSLPRLLKGTAFAKGVKLVRINDPLPVSGDPALFDRRLRDKLGEALDAGLVDDDNALLRQMQLQKLSTLVVALTWRASELGGDAMEPLRRVFDYWARFPALPPNTLAGCIVCLKYDRAPAAGGWLRRMFGQGDASQARADVLRAAVAVSEKDFGAKDALAWCVAKELPSIKVADVDRWVRDVATLLQMPAFSVPEAALQALIGGDELPMQQVLPKLGGLLPSN